MKTDFKAPTPEEMQEITAAIMTVFKEHKIHVVYIPAALRGIQLDVCTTLAEQSNGKISFETFVKKADEIIGFKAKDGP